MAHLPKNTSRIAAYEAALEPLIGRRIRAITYWDIYNYSDQPRTWDYGDWHHAVMGVELVTDAGPVSIVWTNTFWPYGVEVFDSPISEHLTLGDEGPEGWAVGDHHLWQARSANSITLASYLWERLSIGPGHRNSDGARVSEPFDLDVPVGLRLDLGEVPVWFVAGMPEEPGGDRVLVPGDEIMVVFTPSRLRRIGFPSGKFVDG